MATCSGSDNRSSGSGHSSGIDNYAVSNSTTATDNLITQINILTAKCRTLEEKQSQLRQIIQLLLDWIVQKYEPEVRRSGSEFSQLLIKAKDAVAVGDEGGDFAGITGAAAAASRRENRENPSFNYRDRENEDATTPTAQDEEFEFDDFDLSFIGPDEPYGHRDKGDDSRIENYNGHEHDGPSPSSPPEFKYSPENEIGEIDAASPTFANDNINLISQLTIPCYIKLEPLIVTGTSGDADVDNSPVTGAVVIFKKSEMVKARKRKPKPCKNTKVDLKKKQQTDTDKPLKDRLRKRKPGRGHGRRKLKSKKSKIKLVKEVNSTKSPEVPKPKVEQTRSEGHSQGEGGQDGPRPRIRKRVSKPKEPKPPKQPKQPKLKRNGHPGRGRPRNPNGRKPKNKKQWIPGRNFILVSEHVIIPEETEESEVKIHGEDGEISNSTITTGNLNNDAEADTQGTTTLAVAPARKFQIQSRYRSIKIIKLHHCTYCPKTFKSPFKLKRHLRGHTGENPYSCEYPECGKTFRYDLSLKRHRLFHTGEKPFICEICGKTFQQGGNLKLHMRVHDGVKPFECGECGKRFRQSTNRNSHIKNWHTEGGNKFMKHQGQGQSQNQTQPCKKKTSNSTVTVQNWSNDLDDATVTTTKQRKQKRRTEIPIPDMDIVLETSSSLDLDLGKTEEILS